MDAIEFRLLNEFQRNFPLVSEPFVQVARKLGATEGWVRERLAAYQADGTVSRVGAVFAPGVFGASTLAALEVPSDRLEAVAELVSARPEVNHNYEREHRVNLWFVAAAQSAARLCAVLDSIEQEARCGALLRLPLVEEFRLDLGFDLRDAEGEAQLRCSRHDCEPQTTSDLERSVLAGLQEGLQLVPRPYFALARTAGLIESQVLALLRRWTAQGAIRRLGVIVRHRELGYRANAMVVWQVPESVVRPLGLRLAQAEGVTLCYRRTPVPGRWPYNLYCMIHARCRDQALAKLAHICAHTGLDAFPHEVLFSAQRFKQRGARYLAATQAVHA